MDKEAFERALHEQNSIGCELVGYVKSLLRGGEIPAHREVSVRRMVEEHGRTADALKRAIGWVSA